MRHPGGGPDLLNKVRWDIVRFTRGNGIEIGRGPHKAFAHFIGTREESDNTMDGIEANFTVKSFDNLEGVIEGSLDFVFAWGVEVPSKGYDFSPARAIDLLKDGGYYLKAEEHHPLMVFQKTEGELELIVDCVPDKPTALVVRYGAIGDAIQTANVIRGLHNEGYHVTFNCHPVGEEILRHDPHVGAFWVQDQNQVANQELAQYWKHLATKFDRFVNLSESVEGTLLAFPGRSNHGWPKEVRHKYMNLNYLEFMSEIALLPYEPGYQFYPSNTERHKARDMIERCGKDAYIILWALSGSGQHKMYPHTDNVVAQTLLDIPNAHVFFVGSDVDAILAAGWEKEPRVHDLCGELNIRQTIALAQQAHMVVGPETGVLNAVAFETNSKIVMLSHSSENNLTRDWTNTQSLASTDTPCYPCHRLHENREFCPRQDDGAARCQSELRPEVVSAAIDRAYADYSAVKRIILP